MPRHGDLPSTENTSDKPFDRQQNMGAWGRDKLSVAVSKVHCNVCANVQIPSGLATAGPISIYVKGALFAQVRIADPHATEMLKGACDAEPQLMVRDDRLQAGNCHLMQHSVQHDADVQADSLCLPDDPKCVYMACGRTRLKHIRAQAS